MTWPESVGQDRPVFARVSQFDFDKPSISKGYLVKLAPTCLLDIGVSVCILLVVPSNRRRDRGEMNQLLVGASVDDMVQALEDAGADFGEVECVLPGELLLQFTVEERHATLVVGEVVNYREGQFAAVAYSDSGAKKLLTAPTLDELAGLAVIFAAA